MGVGGPPTSGVGLYRIDRGGTMSNGKSGWVTFSWIIFLVAGIVNVLYGAAALVRKEYFPSGGLIYAAIQQHGWIWLLLGLLQIVVALAIAYRMSFGRIAGIIFAVLAAVVWFFYMLYLPFVGFGLIVIYVLVIFALAAHGEDSR